MIESKAADAATTAAEAAIAAAVAARDGAQIAFLDTVTSIKQIDDGTRTRDEVTRLKSRYISVFGYDRWVKLTSRR